MKITIEQAAHLDSILKNILDKKDVVNDYENYGLPFNWTLTYNYSF